MITFITWVALIGTGIAALVWVTLACVVFARIRENWHRTGGGNLPPPERQTERTFGQQYFERAIGRKISPK